jgi:hypothetical protein
MVMTAKIEPATNCVRGPSSDKALLINVDKIEAAIEKTISMKETYTSRIEGSWTFLNLGTIM